MRVSVEIFIHFGKFQNIDLFHQGLYRLRVSGTYISNQVVSLPIFTLIGSLGINLTLHDYGQS